MQEHLQRLVRWAGLYFALAFAISWTCWWAAALSGREWTSPPVALLFAIGGFGPAIAAAFLVSRDGRDARRDFVRRLWDWRRVGVRWWAIIVVLAFGPQIIARLLPLEAGDETAALGLATLPVLVVGLVAGLAEEPGWRGYAQDRLGAAYSPLAAGLVVGVFWSAWHLPLYFIDGTFQNEIGIVSSTALLFFLTIVPASVLYAWIFVNTGRSILAVIVFHALANLAGEMVPVREAAQVATFVVISAIAMAVARGSGLRGGVRLVPNVLR